MWLVKTAAGFKKSLRRLELLDQERIEQFFDERRGQIEDPFLLSDFKSLKGQENAYRLRFGKFRVGVILDHENQWFVLRYVGARGDFYKHFP